MIFEHFLLITSIFAIFPFDNILDVTSIPTDEEILRGFYTPYINSNLFQSDLKNNHLIYIEKPGYYENLMEKFLASTSQNLTIPKSCNTNSKLADEWRIQFIKYISFQEFKVFESIIIKISPFILPTYFVYAIFPYVKISYAILFTIKGIPFYKNLMLLFFEQNLNRNYHYSMHVLAEISKFLFEN